MTSITFDSLGYFEKLKEAGVPEAQARVQAAAMREQSEHQAAALQKALDKYDEASRKDLATKGDIQDVRAELQDVRAELKQDIHDVRSELLRLENKMEASKHEVLKWVVGTMIAQTALIVAVIAFLR